MVMTKTNTYLADGMEHYADMHRPYIYGTWGQVLTEAILMSKAALYPDHLSPARVEYAKKHYLGKRTDDCHGGIKNLLWLPTGANYDGTPIYDPKTDINADEAFRRAKVKGPISTIPKVRGICVRYPGHVGVLTDPLNGIVCEFRGFDYGCVRTKLSARRWTDWYEHPYFSYETKPIPTPTPEPKGDTCMIEMPVVKRTNPTMQGEFVKTLQRQLNAFGFKDKDGHELDVDGKAGGKTIYVLTEAQKKWGLKDDGICGEKTWSRVLKG